MVPVMRKFENNHKVFISVRSPNSVGIVPDILSIEFINSSWSEVIKAIWVGTVPEIKLLLLISKLFNEFWAASSGGMVPLSLLFGILIAVIKNGLKLPNEDGMVPLTWEPLIFIVIRTGIAPNSEGMVPSIFSKPLIDIRLSRVSLDSWEGREPVKSMKSKRREFTDVKMPYWLGTVPEILELKLKTMLKSDVACANSVGTVPVNKDCVTICKVISEDIWPISEGKVPESLELPLKRKMVTKLNMPTCVGMEPEISWLLKMARFCRFDNLLIVSGMVPEICTCWTIFKIWRACMFIIWLGRVPSKSGLLPICKRVTEASNSMALGMVPAWARFKITSVTGDDGEESSHGNGNPPQDIAQLEGEGVGPPQLGLHEAKPSWITAGASIGPNAWAKCKPISTSNGKPTFVVII
jgi:hypothetical protein